jgi:hypothetical protein
VSDYFARNEQRRKQKQMKKNKTTTLAALALLLIGLLFSACSANTGREGTHKMGSAPMSNAKMPGSHPERDR